jgi:hypothetical protein
MKKISPFKTVLLFLFFTIILSSCKKDKNLLTAEATIINMGGIESDGCGWVFKLDDKTSYSPTNMEAKYQENNLKVIITYHLLTTKAASDCHHTQIELVSIIKK